ncbi:MAG TPA: PAS domain S-box protein [Polyangiaceae bacterium]|jgi:hypothetical protein
MTPSSTHSIEESLRRVLAGVAGAFEQAVSIVRAQGEPVIAFTAARVILAASAAAEALFGYDALELDGQSVDRIIPERLRQPGAPPLTARPDIVTVALAGLRKDGTEIDAVWTFGSVRSADAAPVFVMLVGNRGESTARATQEQFRTFADAMPLLAWYAEPDGSVPWFNSRWFEYTGTTPEAHAGRSWESAVDPEDLARVLDTWGGALRSGTPWEDEFRLRRYDGLPRWFLARATPLRNDGGRIVGWLGTNVDVDDARQARDRLRAQAAAELHASEERFHQLVDAVSDYAIFMLDLAGNVLTWNPGVEKIKGYRREEIVGRNFSVFYTTEDRASGRPEQLLETVRRTGRVEDEGWRVRKDGSRFWANVVITALRDVHGELSGFAKVTRDLSARRAADEQAQELLRTQIARASSERASRELERVNRAKDEFLATLSHELRTPLNAIQGWATILQKKPRDEGMLDRAVEAIDRNARSQTKLISDLLDVSRIITGKLRLSMVRTDVVPMLAAALDVVGPAADAKAVRLVLDVDPDLGAMMADPERIQQVVWNLLTNALRFTPRGGCVTVTATRSGSEIRIRVQDTGAGIAPENLPHIFERFMQVDSSTTRQHGGLGLGLSIVRHLVEAHGGSVSVASEGRGRGAAFTVVLPIRPVDEVPAADEDGASTGTRRADPTAPPSGASGPPPAPPSLRGIRVLVVEDEPDSSDVVCTVLRRAGAIVAAATSAQEALNALQAPGQFDLVVSDIGMPGMDGHALLEAMQSGRADVPAIALSAYARHEDAERSLRAGFRAHLTKPVEEGRLLAAVAAFARR